MDWAACFDPDMPGVFVATFGTGSAAVQFFAEPAFDGDGVFSVQSRTYRIAGLSPNLSSIARGDTVAVNGIEYQSVTSPIADEDGVTTIHLEPI